MSAKVEPRQATLRVAAVSYVNTWPLLAGLERDPTAIVRVDVPSRLLDGLLAGEADVALAPVAELALSPERLRLVGDACIAADHSSLTVKLFSKTPLSQLSQVAADTDSRSSVLLLRVLASQAWGRPLTLTPLPADPIAWADLPAVLLIGDKVVSRRPAGFPVEVDLATAWREWTGLPFVFACWQALAGTPSPRVRAWGNRLNASRELGLSDLDALLRGRELPPGWGNALARSYYTEHLSYRLTSPRRRGLARFLREARAVLGRAKP